MKIYFTDRCRVFDPLKEIVQEKIKFKYEDVHLKVKTRESENETKWQTSLILYNLSETWTHIKRYVKPWKSFEKPNTTWITTKLLCSYSRDLNTLLN